MKQQTSLEKTAVLLSSIASSCKHSLFTLASKSCYAKSSDSPLIHSHLVVNCLGLTPSGTAQEQMQLWIVISNYLIDNILYQERYL